MVFKIEATIKWVTFGLGLIVLGPNQFAFGSFLVFWLLELGFW